MPHISNHAVEEQEVIDVLEAPGEDRAGCQDSRIALGQTASGRYIRVVYVPDPEPDSVFVITAYELSGKSLAALSQAQKEETSMSQTKFPTGWNDEKVQRVLAHYEGQTEDEALAEDEAGIEASETVVNVPHDLLPRVRELIAKHRG